MTMYLPNRVVRPAGFEAGEFLEAPTIAVPTETGAGTEEVAGGRENDETSTA
jgi:hypothetical protein